jgi:hypothetical protein
MKVSHVIHRYESALLFCHFTWMLLLTRWSVLCVYVIVRWMSHFERPE